jgi:DNA polymerase
MIVFLGRHALNRFFPTAKISEVHGHAFRRKWQDKDQIFLALYHPAAALYNGSMRETLIADFQKIPKLISKIESETKPTQEKLIN